MIATKPAALSSRTTAWQSFLWLPLQLCSQAFSFGTATVSLRGPCNGNWCSAPPSKFTKACLLRGPNNIRSPPLNFHLTAVRTAADVKLSAVSGTGGQHPSAPLPPVSLSRSVGSLGAGRCGPIRSTNCKSQFCAGQLARMSMGCRGRSRLAAQASVHDFERD
jgi:hypothetical protein